MKRTMSITTVIMVTVCLHAQMSPLPFLWHGRAMGVDFESTNLTAEARSAIKDDIAYCMSLIPATNITFNPLSPGGSGHGKYTGTIRISYTAPINYCGGAICYYKEDAGRTVFPLAPAACASYAAAIDLTNRFSAAVNAFSNFYCSVKAGFDISGLTQEEKKAFFWGDPVEQWAQAEGANFGQALTDALTLRPASTPLWAFPPAPSIRSFSEWPDGLEGNSPRPALLCRVKQWDPVNGNSHWPFVYVNGRWRYCLLEL